MDRRYFVLCNLWYIRVCATVLHIRCHLSS
jgi:hypothetical protein